MSRLFHFAIVAAMMALPAVAMGGDTEIAQSIVKQLQAKKAEGSLKGFNIGLRVEEGVVWLEGHVSNPEQHDMAVDVARRVGGVQRVVDGIRIEGRTAATEPVSTPRELAAADLTQAEVQAEPEAQPAAQEAATPQETPASRFVAQQVEPQMLVQQPMESLVPTPAAQEMSYEAEEEFSFSPVRPASAEKPTSQETASAEAAPAMRPLRPVPVQAHPQARPVQAAQTPYAMGPAGHPAYRMASNNNRGAMAQQPVPVAAPAYYPSQYGYGYGYAAPARYDQPHMPGYAWPAYAAHPNYAAVTYPRQYSPMAWPYIGPFYPYPQVPLGWRSVTMEWEDGWWTLDFKARRHNSF